MLHQSWVMVMVLHVVVVMMVLVKVPQDGEGDDSSADGGGSGGGFVSLYDYSGEVLSLGMLYHNFKNAVREGDRNRVILA